MKKLLIFIVLLQGIIMSADVKNVTINGVNVPVIFEQDNYLPIVSFQLIIKNGGALYDDAHEGGQTKLLSRLLQEGTKSLGSVTFAEKLERKAIHLSSFSSYESLGIELSCLKEHFQEGVEALQSLLVDPNFTSEAFIKSQTMQKGEISRKNHDFDYLAERELKKLLFENTPLSQPLLGELQSVEKLTLQNIENIYHQRMTLDNCIIVVGGDMSFTELEPYLLKVLGALKKSQKSFETQFLQANNHMKTQRLLRDTEQAYIYFGSPFYLKVADEESYKAKVAMFILGSSGFGSRLMEEIRVKRGLAYSAYARVNLNRSSSYMSGYLQTKLDNEEQAIKIVQKVITDFVKKGVTHKELEGAKMFLIGSEPLRNETLSSRLSQTFNEYVNGVALGRSKEDLLKIGQLTQHELNQFIASHPEIMELSFSIVTQDAKNNK